MRAPPSARSGNTVESPRGSPGTWAVTRREIAGRFRVFDVERIELARDGVPQRDAYIFQTRDWCNVLAVTTDDEVLLVRQFRFGTTSFTLELPGGVIDDGEAPIDAAARELAEETGYEVGRNPGPGGLIPLVSCFVNPALQNTRMHAFLARGVRLSPGGTHFDDEEECELVCVPRRDLETLLDRGDIEHALCRLPIETYLRRLRGEIREER